MYNSIILINLIHEKEIMTFRKQPTTYSEQLLRRINQITDYPVRKISDERAFKPLTILLHTVELHHLINQDKELRLTIIQHLTRFGQRAVEALSAYLIFYPDENESYSRIGKARQRHSENHMTYSRIVVAKNLAEIGGTKAFSGLLLAMQQNHLSIVLREIANAIASFGSEMAIQPLVEILLSHPDPGNRKVAAIVLGKFPESESIGALILALKDEDADVAICAVQSLGKIKSGNALSFLIESTNDFRKHSGRSGAEIRVTEAALNAIQSYDTETTHEIVLISSILHLTNDDADLKWAAACRLGEMRDKRAILPLVEALNDKSKKTSYWGETISDAAQLALQKIGTAKARSALADWRTNHP